MEGCQTGNTKKKPPDPLKFVKRKGTTDRGRDYEDSIVANFILRLLQDDNIEDFKVSSNDGLFGAFDDVIMEVEYKNGTSEKYAIQLKHKLDTEVTIQKLKTDAHFSIVKYFKSYQQFREKISGYKLILWTNSKFKPKKDTILKIANEDDGSEFEVKIRECDCFPLLLTSHRGCCFRFEILQKELVREEWGAFFERFFLYTNQIHVDKLKIDEIPNTAAILAPDRSFVDKYLKFVSQWSQREGEKDKLTKLMMEKVVVLLRLDQHIHAYMFGDVTKEAKLLQKAVSHFDITVFSEKSLDKVRGIWGDGRQTLKDKDTKLINDIRKQYQLCDKYVQTIDELTDEQCTKMLWLLDEGPLIVRGGSPDYVNTKLVIITDDLVKGPIFRRLSDLRRIESLYDEVVKEFHFSLLGEEISLQKLIEIDERFGDLVTTDELLSLDLLKQEEEKIPPPYIERFLYKNIIALKYLQVIDERTLVLISNISEEGARYCFKNFDIVDIDNQDGNKRESLQKLQIYVHKNNTTSEKFYDLCKRSQKYKKFHHFNFTAGQLEWIESINGVSDLQEFYIQNDSSVEEEIANLRNKINIIVGDPGIGKTWFVRNLRNHLLRKYLTLVMSPNDVFNLCRFIKDPKNLSHFYDLILTKEIEKLLAENGKLVILWDAIDELSEDERAVVEDLILTLSQNGAINYVTSRRHLKHKLEKKFGVLSKDLQPFGDEQKTRYIRDRLGDATEEVIETVKRSVSVILGTPLHIFMITELFREDPKKYTELVCVTDLYRHFVDQKFHIHFNEKCAIVPNLHNRERLLKQMKLSRIRDYQTVALKLLFDDFLHPNCDDFLKQIITEGDEVGFMVNVRKEDMQGEFLHISYAEYFAAVYLAENCTNINNLADFIFERKYTNVRYFFDMLLAQKCPTHIAILGHNLNYLEKCENLVCHDLQGRCGLHVAASWGERYPLLQAFEIDTNFVVDDKIEHETNPPSVTYQQMLEILLEKCDPQHKDNLFKFTSTMYAEKSECILSAAIIEKTLRSDYIMKKDNNFTCSLLYYAAKYGIGDILDMFGEVRFICNVSNDSLLHLAVQNNHPGFVSRLLSGGVYKRNIDFRNLRGETALLVASYLGFDVILSCLIEAGGDIEASNNKGESPLLWASSNGHSKAAQLLIATGAEVNKRCDEGVTPLFAAVSSGHLDVVRLLIMHNANIETPNKYGTTPLFVASLRGHLEIAQFLIDSQAIIEAKNKDGATALSAATCNGHFDVVKFFVDNHANVNTTDHSGTTPLYVASQNNHLNIVKLLVEGGAHINARKNDGTTPFFIAAALGHLEIQTFLLEHNADINATKCDGTTPLCIACSVIADLDTIKFLLENNANVNAAKNNYATPLHLAALHGFKDVVEVLADNNADLEVKLDDDATPLLVAAVNGRLEVVEVLVRKNANVNAATNEGATPLYVAAASGHLNIVEFLLDNGADVNVTLNNGATPLFKAVQLGYLPIVEVLLENGANIGPTVLLQACKNGHFDIVQSLVEHNANVNATTLDGVSPLLVAAHLGHEKIVDLLLTSGAKVDIINNDGITPLYRASRLGFDRIVKLLMDHGAKVDVRDEENTTPLIEACMYGHTKVAEILIEGGADVNAVDDHNATPIGSAFHNGHYQIAQLLMDAGVDIETIEKCTSPLYAICGFGDKCAGMVSTFIEMGADIDRVEPNGWRCIHLACAEGSEELVKILLGAGADYKTPNSGGETPLDLALARGHENIANLLRKLTRNLPTFL